MFLKIKKEELEGIHDLDRGRKSWICWEFSCCAWSSDLVLSLYWKFSTTGSSSLPVSLKSFSQKTRAPLRASPDKSSCSDQPFWFYLRTLVENNCVYPTKLCSCGRACTASKAAKVSLCVRVCVYGVQFWVHSRSLIGRPACSIATVFHQHAVLAAVTCTHVQEAVQRKSMNSSIYVASTSRNEWCGSDDITGVPSLHKESHTKPAEGPCSTVLAWCAFHWEGGKNEGGGKEGCWMRCGGGAEGGIYSFLCRPLQPIFWIHFADCSDYFLPLKKRG